MGPVRHADGKLFCRRNPEELGACIEGSEGEEGESLNWNLGNSKIF